MLADVHTDLPGQCDRPGVVLGLEFLDSEAIVIRDGFLDHLNRYWLFSRVEEVAEAAESQPAAEED